MQTPRFRLLLAAIFLLVFPFFLRRRPRVERRITILAPPAAIFPFLKDLRNWPLWTAWDQRGEVDFGGDAIRDTGAERRWRNCGMSGALRIVKSATDQRIDYEVTIDGDPLEIIGRIELEPDGACTRVVWKCAWDLAENPYRRYLDLLVRWMLRRDFAQGLANLKALVERAGATEKLPA